MTAPLVIVLPLKTVSEANMRSHRWAKAARAKSQRTTMHLHVLERRRDIPAMPLTVHMTRIAPGLLDDDNLQSAFKAVRDGIASGLGVDDRDPRVAWAYDQRKGARGQYLVEIRIEARA